MKIWQVIFLTSGFLFILNCGRPINNEKETPTTIELSFGTESTFDIITWNLEWFPKSTQTVTRVAEILYALKPDYIIILNGTNDATASFGSQFYLSNSHLYQREFQRNISKTSKNFFFFFDDWLSKNISTYFSLKKIIEKTTGIFLFEAKTREFAANEMSKKYSEGRIYKYFYNINLISKLASKDTYISIFFQPQMLPDNIKGLSDNDQKIFSDFNKQKKFYFSNKQLFYDMAREKIKSINSSDEFKNKKYFQLVDISNLLDFSEHSEDYYSDWVHYYPLSREIIAKRIFQDIEKKIKENLNN